jgi:predicted aminopeptidase
MKHTLFAAVIAIVLFTLSGCYYITEGCNLISVYSKAKDINTVLKEPNLPQDERDLLLLVKDIKAFAVNELGLKDNKNYTTYVKLDKNYLVDVVAACTADSFNQ